jgi:hypothetical protein
MNPDIKESEPLTASAPDIDVAPEPTVIPAADEPLLLPPAPTPTEAQAKQAWTKIYAFLTGLPEYLSEFFGEYQRPLTTVGLIFGAIVSVKLTLALLDAINDIPLLAPTFELIGILYAVWFIYRYLWKASNRDELGRDFNLLKEEVLGGRTPKA